MLPSDRWRQGIRGGYIAGEEADARPLPMPGPMLGPGPAPTPAPAAVLEHEWLVPLAPLPTRLCAGGGGGLPGTTGEAKSPCGSPNGAASSWGVSRGLSQSETLCVLKEVLSDGFELVRTERPSKASLHSAVLLRLSRIGIVSCAYGTTGVLTCMNAAEAGPLL